MISKLCVECGETYPNDEVVCHHCGYDERCACCILYGSMPQNCEPDCDGLTW